MVQHRLEHGRHGVHDGASVLGESLEAGLGHEDVRRQNSCPAIYRSGNDAADQPEAVEYGGAAEDGVVGGEGEALADEPRIVYKIPKNFQLEYHTYMLYVSV
jgi:hypothetical protein